MNCTIAEAGWNSVRSASSCVARSSNCASYTGVHPTRPISTSPLTPGVISPRALHLRAQLRDLLDRDRQDAGGLARDHPPHHRGHEDLLDVREREAVGEVRDLRAAGLVEAKRGAKALVPARDVARARRRVRQIEVVLAIEAARALDDR